MLRLLSALFFVFVFVGLCADEVTISFNLKNPKKNKIFIEGQPSIEINMVKAGYDIEKLKDASCLFTLNTNQRNKHVWVSISPALPAYVKLYLTINTESGALRSGKGNGVSRVALTQVPQICIDNINKMKLVRAPLTYECETSVKAGSFSLKYYTITFEMD